MRKPETKIEQLKRAYHNLLLAVFLTVAYVAVFCWFALPSLSSTVAQFFVLVVPPLIVIGFWAKKQRRALERAEISGFEWQKFIWSQPLMRLVSVAFPIYVLLKILHLVN